MLLKTLRRGFAALRGSTTPAGTAFVICFLFVCLWAALLGISALVSESYDDNYKAAHLSAAEHLQIAKSYCSTISGVFICVPDESLAIKHLDKILPTAPEYPEAVKLLSSIKALRDKQQAIRQQQEQEEAARRVQEQTERTRLTGQSEQESEAQMLRNVGGTAHDAFTCRISTQSLPIMSFDYGHYWWPDDGRCAAKQAREEETRLQTEQLQQQSEQRRRDQDAETYSYWPTTLRVETDMDSFWLPNEERTCQTYPDTKGRVAIVACNASGSHRDHNIPVKFWGGVDRNTISAWKCRRESDEFVCRAID